MHDGSPDPDQEAKARHQAQLEQRHLEAYRNMHRLRNALCRRYAALLSDKVSSQRALLQQREEAARGKSESEAQQKQKKLSFSKLLHDDSYLKPLPKTSYYLGIRVKDTAGVEQTGTPLEACLAWTLLEERADYSRRSEMTKHNLTLLLWRLAYSVGHFNFHKHRPGENAILEHESGSGEGFAELIFGGSQEKEQTEQMFPKITPEIPEKSKKAEIYLRQLRHMHDLCWTNMAFSQRLLDRETDSLSWQEERGNQDLTLPSVDSKQGKTSQTNQAPLCSPKQQSSVRKDRPSCSPPLSRVTSARHPCLETLVWDTATCCRKTPDPLSIEDVCQQEHVEVDVIKKVKLLYSKSCSPQCMALSANPWQARKDQRGEEPTMSAPNTHPEPGFTLYIWELSMKSRDLR
ncbi:Glycine--tRNA ligase alpha subunit [Dissostichus eleginoides]|uniref:Glycine--tRNA ligase alpha subunit n=1 Tax=Dissostichus eleginoides TaxID=100907 RepID=A0AAD9CNI2_DISEL|nr:Glycine--tRNA ligase alpha subunit [Dissostichus eleginoides]